MNEEELENQDSLTTDEEPETSKNEDEVDVELEKQKELANNYKIRAEKAEAEAKKLKLKKEKVKEESPELSQKDVIFLAKADIPEDLIDEVVDYAKYKGISVAESYNSSTMQALISEKKEEAKTAEATQVRGGQRGAMKQSEESIIEKARQGKEIDPEKVAEARMALKKKAKGL